MYKYLSLVLPFNRICILQMKVFDLVGERSDHYITSVTSDMIATNKTYELQIVGKLQSRYKKTFVQL